MRPVPLSCVAFSPDGRRILSGIEDHWVGRSEDNKLNTVKVWEADTGRELLTFKGHAGDSKTKVKR